MKPSEPEVSCVKKIHAFWRDTNTDTLVSGNQYVTNRSPVQGTERLPFDSSQPRNIQRITRQFIWIKIRFNHRQRRQHPKSYEKRLFIKPNLAPGIPQS